MGRPLLRTPELADRFVQETLHILEHEGSAAVTTRAVATAAESSLAAINDLFGSKSGLLNSVALHGFSLLLEALDAAEPQDNHHENLMALCRSHRSFTTAHPQLAAHMYSRPYAGFQPTPNDLMIAKAIRRHFTVRFADLLGEPKSSSLVFDTSVGLVALLEGLSHQQRAGTLGSTTPTRNRRWQTAVGHYLKGAVA